MLVVAPGRIFRRYEDHPPREGFIKSTTAAAAGAIAGAAIVIAGQTVKTPLPVAIAAIALGLLVQPWGY